MDIEKFKLDLLLRGYKFEHKSWQSTYPSREWFARIINADFERSYPELKNEKGCWKYFSWGNSEQEVIEEVYRQWTTRKKS